MPRVPTVYIRDFLRGYFDGDGCISHGCYKRKNRKSKVLILMVRFASASREFLNGLKQQLTQKTNLKYGFITEGSGCYYLTYSKEDSKKLFRYMYENINEGLYLKRKYNKFKEALKIFGAVV